MLKADWGVSTDPGPHRSLNEDSYLAEPAVFAVADGMGGHAAGEIASGIVIAALRQLASRTPLRPDDIGTTIAAANDEIVQRGLEQSTTAGMGTTVTGVAVVSIGGSDHWAVFNVGDSRVYRFAENRLQQITVDHSEIEELIAAGHLSREEARTDHRRHIITRALGTVPAPPADLWVFPPTADEQFLICSDGLTDELTDGELQDILRAAATPRDASSLLVNAAIRAGGRDNVTALVVGLAADHDSSSDIDEDTTPHVAAGTG